MNSVYMLVLSHPIREQALRRLLELGETSPKGLADALDIGLPNVAYHIRYLLRHGPIIKPSRTVPRRGALEHYYKFADARTRREIGELFAVLDQLHGAVGV